MRIGIDVRAFSQEKKSGVEEYLENLLVALFNLDRKNEYILFYNSYKKGLPKVLELLERYPNVFLRRYRYPNKLLNLSLWYLKYPLLDKLLNVKVFYSPNIMFSAISARCPHLLTIHDLSFDRHPEFFNFKRRVWHWLVNARSLARKAVKIITVSESTKDDLLELYRMKPEKVLRIYPGLAKDLRQCAGKGLKVGDQEKVRESVQENAPQKPDQKDLIDQEQELKNSLNFHEIKGRYDLPEKYILTLSTLEPRKNIDSVILAFQYLKKQHKIDHKLVIAGGQGWLFERTQQLINNSKYREDIMLIGEVESEDRKYLYVGADLFVYPSFYEGFGFPPLEALAVGTTVVCSHISSLPEVVGNSALLVDPYNREEIAWAMERGLKDKKLKTMLKQSGFEQARRFEWQKSAKKFLEVIEGAGK